MERSPNNVCLDDVGVNNMNDIIIAGAGEKGKKLCRYINDYTSDKVIAILDNNENLYENNIDGIKIMSFEEGIKLDFDRIIVSPFEPKIYSSMEKQLLELGVISDKVLIDALSSEYMEAFVDQRISYIKNYAEYVHDRLDGNVAECGVFRGDSAKYINKYFYDRKFYLFDTFEGFGKEDLEYETKADNFVFDNEFFNEKTFNNTSINLVMNKMSHPEKIETRKGLFPETAEGLDDKFVFVNLDMDLYQPMLAGLEYFYDRMVKGGCLLLHDYFHSGLGGVKVAVEDFEKRHNIILNKTPIGDSCSIAIIK